MTKILLVGKIGQLGWELQRTLACLGELQAVDYPEIDLREVPAVRALMRAVRPDVLVNAAAYTDVDGAESNYEVAQQINGIAPGILAEELSAAGGRLVVHYSTDYVFNGTSSRPYAEEDAVDPINRYGLSKLQGEQAVVAAGSSHLIFRTQWLYGPRGKNFLLTILRLARQGKPLCVVSDQVGAPTSARMLAEATALALSSLQGRDPRPFTGIYHVTAAGQASWYEFTKAILEETCALSARPPWCVRALESLQACSTADYPFLARRPAYAVLSNAKFAHAFGFHLPAWREQLRLCLQELEGSAVLS